MRVRTAGDYIQVRRPDHPRASNGRVPEHILVAEKALGRFLPAGAEVHHVNEMKDDNRPQNLVICEDRTYHALLHVRTRVLRAGGRPGRDKVCGWCRRALPKCDFGPDPGRSGGLNYACRACRLAPVRPERTACGRGHPWTPENTYIRPDTGSRQCRACSKGRPKGVVRS